MDTYGIKNCWGCSARNIPQIYDDDDFLDILYWFNCKSRVTIMNVYGVILEIAKQ